MVTLPSLHKKLFRDIRSAKVQFGAVIFVILLGISIYVCSYAAYLNLDISYQRAYSTLKMADYWLSFDYIGQNAARDLNKIPGVTAEGRIVNDLSVRMDRESGEKITGRVVSLPAHRSPDVNDVQVSEGSYFSATPNREVLVEKHFADYHNLKPGDRLTLEIDNQTASFEIKGIVISPEYLWVAKSAQEPFATPRTFGIFYLVQPTVEELFSMNGLFNELTLILDENVDYKTTFDHINRVLRTYGISRLVTKDDASSVQARKIDIFRGARVGYMVERKDQVSNKLLKQDLDGFREMAFLFPLLFLVMAALTIYVLLNRLIESQRIQIGLMKAIGYGRAAILFHYMGYSLFVGVTGSLFGILLGNVLADGLTKVYIQQLGIPIAVILPHPEVLFIGFAVGIVVPVISGVMPAWFTARIRPAEAMRSTPPIKGSRSLVEIVLPFLSNLPYVMKLPLRNISRNIQRTLFMALGVASAVMLTLISLSFVDAMDNLLNVYFNRIQQYDAVVHLQGLGSTATARYISQLPGIERAESILEMPYRIRNGNFVSDSSILGIEKDSTLFGLIDAQSNRTYVTPDGILIPLALQKKLEIVPGDIVQLEPLQGVIGDTQIQFTEFVDIPIGSRSYLPLTELQKIIRSHGTATEVLIKFINSPSPDLLKRINNIDGVISIEFTGDTREFINSLMGFFWVFIGFMLMLGASLGAAIIFNGTMVNVLQRKREIAIMRAIGMSNRRLTAILTIENVAIGCIGVVLGFPSGYWVANYFMTSVDTETFSLMTIILPRSYAIAAVFALTILLLSQIPALRQVFGMSLPTATKDWTE